MEFFLFILINNIAPIFLIISLGYIIATIFDLDIFTLSKLHFYIFVPALIIVEIYNTEIKDNMLKVLIFSLLLIIVLDLLVRFIAKLRKNTLCRRNAIKNSAMFYNAGNFGIPLIMLIFKGTPYEAHAMSIQIIILVIQGLTFHTIGFYNAGRGQMDYKNTIKKIFTMPPVYSVAVVMIMKLCPYNFSEFFLWPSIEYLAKGFIPVALLALGAQLSRTKFNIRDLDIHIATIIRLCGGPLVAFILLKLMGITGVTAQVLFISSAVPAAVNTALIAVEFDNEPDFASQVVLSTTIISSITLTAIIYLSEIIFTI